MIIAHMHVFLISSSWNRSLQVLDRIVWEHGANALCVDSLGVITDIKNNFIICLCIFSKYIFLNTEVNKDRLFISQTFLFATGQI